MHIVVVGLSHKTAPVAVREKLSIPEARRPEAIAELCAQPHILEAAVLSTCNRLEVYLVTAEAHQGIREATQYLADSSGVPLPHLRQHLFMLLHQDAVMHLLRVAAGLDSLVLGEGQILAQVKHCHKIGQQAQGVKSILNRLFKQALETGKRVRTETSIGTGAVSISSAAAELALLKAPDLSQRRIAIIGAGKMARLLVIHLLSKGVTGFRVINRSVERANALAEEFPQANLTVHTYSEMLPVLAQSDVAFTSTAATEPILDRAVLASILATDQPLMLFDISVPRNVHDDVNQLPHVHVFNVDDLKAVVSQNQEARRQMVREAEVILEQDWEAFDLWWQALETVPTINCLRDKVETIRVQEMEKALSRLGAEFAEKHQEVIEALTRAIVNKILHDPMVQLRAQRDIEARRQALQTLQDLFNLEAQTAQSQG